MPTVGVVSPGAMGSALAHALSVGGARVVATISGRSERTSRFADRAGIELVPDLAAVVRDADIVLSIVPPEHATAVAEAAVSAAGGGTSRPLLVELNATSPETVRRIAASTSGDGIELVDGSISGPPPWDAGTTRVYLSGPRADDVAALPFAGVETIVVSAQVGAASAVKMSTASVYKGTAALLAQALLSADANGVLEHVLSDLRSGSPELVASVARRLASAASKSGRYVGEMREIAATQEAAGLTPALFDGMADVFAALSASELARSVPEEIPTDATLDDVLAGLQSARRTNVGS